MPLDPAKGSMNVLFAKPGIDPSQCRKEKTTSAMLLNWLRTQ
jgi:hypothetical protein